MSLKRRTLQMATPARVVDTSVWIEWLAGSEIGKMLGTKFPKKAPWRMPAMVRLELSSWRVGAMHNARGSMT